MKFRSNQLELMDLGPAHYAQAEYNDCLTKLGWIGILLGGDRATNKAINDLPSNPTSILDVGCGNGALTATLARKYPRVSVVGIDISADAIKQAVLQNPNLPNLSFQHRTNPRLSEPPKSYDVVTCCLLCHHLTNEQIVQFLQNAAMVARRAIIINDLHRHWLAYALFWLVSPLFGNRMLRHDGLISICRGFTRQELLDLLTKAGLAQRATITWRWAFRWVVTVSI